MFESVGFIGVGMMGTPILRNLVSAGYRVVAYVKGPRRTRRTVRHDVLRLSLVAARRMVRQETPVMTHRKPPAPRLLSLPEVAERLGISNRSVRTLVALGRISTIRPTPRRVLVSEDDLNAYILSCRERARPVR